MTATRSDPRAVLGRIRSSTLLTGHDGRSGARIARAMLDDGTPVVIKRVRRSDDLGMLATGDVDGREARLWSDGVLDRLPKGVSHPVLAAGWIGDELVTCMSDLTGHVLTWERVLSAAELRRLFGAAARIHAAFVGEPPAGLCPLLTRLSMLTPQRMGPLAGPAHPLPALILRGWERFADLVPSDVAAAVFAAHADPARIARGLAAAPTTLLHGDLTLVNVALGDEDLALLDWSLATAGPAVLDFVWFIAGCATHVDLPFPALLDEIRTACRPWHDERALRAALFWGLAGMGWNKALDATEHPDPSKRAAGHAELRWWTARARDALDTAAFG